MSDRKTIQLRGGEYDGRVMEVRQDTRVFELTTIGVGEALLRAREGEVHGMRYESHSYYATGEKKDDGTEYFVYLEET